jgi:hypothetical protein
MARGSGNAIFRATVKGYRRTAGRLSEAGRMVQPVLNAEFRGRLSDQALQAFRNHAPEETGALKEALIAPVSSRGGTVVVTVRSPVRDERSGYAYTGVTRFGHRKKWIVPRRAAFLRFFWAGKGRWVTAMRVRGQRPGADWVDTAMPEVNRAVDQSADRIGRAITTRIL